MPPQRVQQPNIDRAVELYQETGSCNVAAKRMGCSQTTVLRYLRKAGINPNGAQLKPKNPSPPGIILPDFPSENIPIDAILDLAEKRFSTRRASYDAHTWFPVKIKSSKAIGILWFGDPHIDDNGCNISLLRHHVRLCKETDGLYGANIGDTTNNWAGRLVRLYAKQDASVATARRLAEWFMLDSGVRWLIWLIGNHDEWGDGSEILAQMAKRHGTQKVICHDWEARFSLVFPGGWSPKIFASHDFKGHSQWNPLHGPMKEGQMGEEADLYVCGHKHNSAEFGFENVARGLYQRFVRVRGYKFFDEYARHGGFKEQKTGCGALTIFDPERRSISNFFDIDEGVEFLKLKRARK